MESECERFVREFRGVGDPDPAKPGALVSFPPSGGTQSLGGWIGIVLDDATEAPWEGWLPQKGQAMYRYLGDASIGEHYYGVPAGDLSDEQVDALGEAFSDLVKSSPLYRHEPDTGKKAKARAQEQLAQDKADAEAAQSDAAPATGDKGDKS